MPDRISDDLTKAIIEDNLIKFRHDAKNYDLLHPDIFNSREQHRLKRILSKAVSMVQNPSKLVLDLGADTGNVTSILLDMPHNKVVASDLSLEMLQKLKSKFKNCVEDRRLFLVCVNAEHLPFKKSRFGLVTMFSVVHHIPDYVKANEEIGFALAPGGVLFIDHEPSADVYGYSHIRETYYRFSIFLNSLYCKFHSIKGKNYKSRYADFYTSKDHQLVWSLVEDVNLRNNLRVQKKMTYLNYKTVYFNPLTIS